MAGHSHKHDHDHSHDHAHEHEHDHPHIEAGHGCCSGHACASNEAAPAPIPAAHLEGKTEEAVFFIQKMDCPTEEKLIRERLSQMTGVGTLEFNLIQRELTVQHQLPSIAPLVDTLKALDMLPAVKSDSLDAEAGRDAPDQAAAYRIPARRWALLGLAGVAALGAEVLAWTSGNDRSLPVIALAIAAILLGGLGTLKKGWIALRNFSLNMNFLMSLAVIGAAVIGQWPEAAVVIVLFTLAEMIEALSLDRARNAIAGLMAMTPDMATRRGADGVWSTVPARTVTVDETVRVAPGERVPLDGLVLSGSTRCLRDARDGRARRLDPGAHRQERAAGARPARPDPALRGQLRALLHPGRGADGGTGGRAAAAADGCPLPAVAVQGPGPAGDRLPLRAGDLHAGDYRQRTGLGGAAWHPGQGRRLPGARPPIARAGIGQDRHDYLRQTRRDRCGFAAGRGGSTGASATGGLAGIALGPPGLARHCASGRHRHPGGERLCRPGRTRRAGAHRRTTASPGQSPPGARAGPVQPGAGGAPASLREAGQDHHRAVPRRPAAVAGGGGRHGAPQQQGSGSRAACAGRGSHHADRRQQPYRASYCQPDRHCRCARGPAAGRQAQGHRSTQRAPRRARGGHGRRRHQRCPGAGAGRHRFRHGRGRH
ncbi:hypothetical protein Lal_00037089 [Lupinus albus]|nr:hypothetical protein Lal_00037089 [Lupinus albus]